MRPAELLQCAKNNEIARCEIRPAWNGTGRYVIWIHTRTRQSSLLSHEDGAPLLFPDSARAFAKAVQCGVPPRVTQVRWPPTSPPSGAGRRPPAEPVANLDALRTGVLDSLLMVMDTGRPE